ncbi:Chloroperoxidase-like protein [Cladobotryum mycophilum]|uniref:Chloroperoxidase-like protein n=1 Tax=Cladobotryum mycophilum TaxID=491253 RepID=A0ABR0S774_9HYPO
MLLSTVLSLAAVAVASPTINIKPWIAPGPNDSRGPCPMLNTLANHGYLPHDGKNISVQQFGDAVAAINVHPNIGLLPAGIFANATKKERFDLVDLNIPGIEQHIASLTRQDWDQTHPHLKPDSKRIEDFLADSNTDFVSLDSIGISRLRLEAASKPKELKDTERKATLFEASLLMTMMMDGPIPAGSDNPNPAVYIAPKKRVRFWLNEEKLPIEQGWKPLLASSRSLTCSLSSMASPPP